MAKAVRTSGATCFTKWCYHLPFTGKQLCLFYSSSAQECPLPCMLVNIVYHPQSFVFGLRGSGRSKFLIVARLIGKKIAPYSLPL